MYGFRDKRQNLCALSCKRLIIHKCSVLDAEILFHCLLSLTLVNVIQSCLHRMFTCDTTVQVCRTRWPSACTAWCMLITITHYQRPRSAACKNVSPYRAFLSNKRWSFLAMMFVIMSFIMIIRSNPMEFESAWRTIWEENTTFSFTISVRRQCNLEIRSRSPKLIPVRYFLFEKKLLRRLHTQSRRHPQPPCLDVT